MAEVINIFRDRKPEPPSVALLVADAIQYISQDWERAAARNKLSEYFLEQASTYVAGDINYILDLNAIGNIEQKLGMALVVRSPYGRQLGWRASFIHKTGTAQTPDMPFESYARCFNILLYIKLKRDLASHGIKDEL